MSCSLFNLNEMTPKLNERINKDIVDVKKWKTTALYSFKPTVINKIPNWADAIYIINFFKLYEWISKIEKINVRIDPNNNKKSK